MFNLTSHVIIVCALDGTDHTFLPYGVVARVEMWETVVGACPVTGAPIIRRTAGDTVALPKEGTPCIVSAMVAASWRGRAGVFAPDTGPTAIRDEHGQIVAVTRLVAA